MFVQPQGIVSPISPSRPRDHVPPITEAHHTERVAHAPNPAVRVLEGELLASERRRRNGDRRTQGQDSPPGVRRAAPRAPQGAPPAIRAYLQHALPIPAGGVESSTQIHILA